MTKFFSTGVDVVELELNKFYRNGVQIDGMREGDMGL